MALTSGDVIKITTRATYISQDILNVFYYLIESVVVGITLLDLLAEFRDSVRDVMTPTQNASMAHAFVDGENVSNGLDKESLSAFALGTDSAGEAVNSATAAGYDLIVGDRTTRKGGKRLAGVSEGRMTSNTYQGPAPETAALETAMGATLSASGTPSGSAQMVPVVVGRLPDGSLDLSRVAPIVSVAVRQFVTTQVSRKQVPL